MRRPVMYLAGLLLATGASLALAGPASAAPAKCHHNSDAYWDSDADDYSIWYSETHTDINSHNSWSLLNVGGLLGSGGVTSGL